MKKVLFFVALATFTAGTISSCGKSTKGKMDGEWTIDAFEQTGVYTSYSGNKETDKESISGTTHTYSYENSGNPSWNSTSTATVTGASWTIKKDGTWERTITLTETSGGTTYTTSTVESGEWDFLSGVGEYKKNERIAFNTLSIKRTYSETTGSVTDSDTYSDTYLDGEVASVFVITESKKKSLKMEFEGNNVSTDSDGDKSTSTIKGTYTLSSSK